MFISPRLPNSIKIRPFCAKNPKTTKKINFLSFETKTRISHWINPYLKQFRKKNSGKIFEKTEKLVGNCSTLPYNFIFGFSSNEKIKTIQLYSDLQFHTSMVPKYFFYL